MRFKKIILVAFLFVLCGKVWAGDRCFSFKTGKFKLTEASMGIDQIIERRDNLQIETDLKTGEECRYIINWLDDCEYELTILQGTHEAMNFYKNKTLVVRIIELYSDGYKFEGHIKGSGDYSSHVMKKIQ